MSDENTTEEPTSVDRPHIEAPQPDPAPATRETGTIKTYVADKGFGFIARYGEPDIFFHVLKFETPEGPPEVGQRVSFEVAPSERKPGSLAAVNVRGEEKHPASSSEEQI